MCISTTLGTTVFPGWDSNSRRPALVSLHTVSAAHVAALAPSCPVDSSIQGEIQYSSAGNTTQPEAIPNTVCYGAETGHLMFRDI